MRVLAAILCTALASGCESGGVAVDPPPPAGDPAGTHTFRLIEIARGLEHPWAVALLPGGDVLVTERPGRVRLVRGGQLRPEPVPGGPAAVPGGQGGLLDIAVHPAFETNRLIYFSYSKGVAGGRTTAVARARWEGDRLEGVEDIFVADAVGGDQHFGSRIVFDRAGYLYVTIGDRGRMERAQELADHVGTTVRLHDDGRVPADNPFVGRAGARPEIYSFGHRNSQGMAIDPQGRVWQNEHGALGGDEFNRIEAGANYGWPRARFGSHYDGTPIPVYRDGDGFMPPVLSWTPAIAPSGLTFYGGDRFPNWRGNALHGGLVGRQIHRVVLDGTTVVHQEVLPVAGERIRYLTTGPDGYLYILTDSPNGILARLEPTG
jgi:aldose sugar dehydrogenase